MGNALPKPSHGGRAAWAVPRKKNRAASGKDAALAGLGNGEKDLRQKGAGKNHSRSSQAKP